MTAESLAYKDRVIAGHIREKMDEVLGIGAGKATSSATKRDEGSTRARPGHFEL